MINNAGESSFAPPPADVYIVRGDEGDRDDRSDASDPSADPAIRRIAARWHDANQQPRAPLWSPDAATSFERIEERLVASGRGGVTVTVSDRIEGGISEPPESALASGTGIYKADADDGGGAGVVEAFGTSDECGEDAIASAPLLRFDPARLYGHEAQRVAVLTFIRGLLDAPDSDADLDGDEKAEGDGNGEVEAGSRLGETEARSDGELGVAVPDFAGDGDIDGGSGVREGCAEVGICAVADRAGEGGKSGSRNKKKGALLITGPSGSGKTALIRRTIAPHLRSRGGCLATGKFDRPDYGSGGLAPFLALSSALVELVDFVLNQGEDVIEEVRGDVLEGVGESWFLVSGLMPNLGRVMEPPAPPSVSTSSSLSALPSLDAPKRKSCRSEAITCNTEGTTKDSNASDGESCRRHILSSTQSLSLSADNLKYVLRHLVRSICAPGRPVVLFLDDLQWADAPTLELVRHIVTDPENDYIALVMALRDNEVYESDHPLFGMVNAMEGDGCSLERIEVGELDHNNVRVLVADALGADEAGQKEAVERLGEIVHRKTGGNALFVVQFLQSLREDGLLRHEGHSGQWWWDVDEIEVLPVTDDVAGMLARKMKTRLSWEAREVLKVASCFGSAFDRATLAWCVVSKNGDDNARPGAIRADLDEILSLLVREGLLLGDDRDPRSGSNEKVASGRSGARERYTFIHDRVLDAASSLMGPPDDRSRCAYHLLVGNAARTRVLSSPSGSSHPDNRELLYLAADQLNRGSSLVTNPDQMAELARLNLEAGRAALRVACAPAASSYLRAGLDLLPHGRQWADEKYYFLCLELHTCYGDAAYRNGNYDAMEQALQEVYQNARTLLDALPARLVTIGSLGARDRAQEAIDAGLALCAKLGEPFPEDVSKTVIGKEMLKTKLVFGRKKPSSILSLNPMTNERKRAVMDVLGCIFSLVYRSRQQYVPLVVMRMVRLSAKYGLSDASAYGFVMYGMLLCGTSGDVETGYAFGEAALKLANKAPPADSSRRWLAGVYVTYYTLVRHWRRPLAQSVAPLLEGHKRGMETGSVDTAMLCYQLHCTLMVMSGRYSLVECELQFRRATDIRPGLRAPAHFQIWQLVLNLMGRSPDPLVLTGEAMNQDRALRAAESRGNRMAVCFMYYHRMILLYLFGEYSAAADMAEKSRNIAVFAVSNFHVTQHAFYEGMNAFAMAAKDPASEKKWKQLGKSHTAAIEKWDGPSSESGNRRHMVLLMKAEHSALKGKREGAMELYNGAVLAASGAGFVQHEALANERAGAFLARLGKEGTAVRYLRRARECYLEWGAKAKVDYIDRRYASVLGATIKQ